MDELIKSEAGKHYEDQGYVLNKDDTELIIDTFTAGFNRCLELAKMDNEEEFEKWYALHWNMPEIKRYPSHGFENQEKAFLAASKLKDVEIMELKKENEKLKVAVDLLKSLRDTIDLSMDSENNYIYWQRDNKEALEKIKEEK